MITKQSVKTSDVLMGSPPFDKWRAKLPSEKRADRRVSAAPAHMIPDKQLESKGKIAGEICQERNESTMNGSPS